MMHKRLISSLLFLPILFVILSATSFASAGKIIQARIYLTPEIQTEDVLPLQLDVAYIEPGEYLDFITDAKQVEDLREKGWEIEIIHDDLVSFYTSRLDPTLDMGGYHTYEEAGHFLDSIHSAYPAITTDTIPIGYTWEGRSIWAFKISDNPESEEDEPEVLYNGLHHAREPITLELQLYFITYLCENYGSDPEVTDLVNSTQMWFVPVLNPDGYEYNRQIAPDGGGMWRKNRRDNGDGTFGVDLNRNYSVGWAYNDIGSSPNTGSLIYRGPEPFSEPELQALGGFFSDHDFVLALNYHAFGSYVACPWEYANIEPTDYPVDKLIGDSLNYFTGYVRVVGTINGSADDWNRGEQIEKNKVFGYTVEVGTEFDGFWPPTYRIPLLCQLHVQPNLFYARMANRLHDHSYRYIQTDPSFVYTDTLMSEDSTGTMNLRIYNHDTSSAMYYDITTPDSVRVTRPYPLLAFKGNADYLYDLGEPPPSGSVVTLPSLGKPGELVADWLKIDQPTGTIPAGSYQDLDIILDGTVIQGSYYGTEYLGAVVIGTSNDRTPLYCDTSAFAVGLTLYLDYWEQYQNIHTDELITSICNSTNVGYGMEAGMRYLDSQGNFLNQGSFFTAYVSDQSDTIIHRDLFNTHSMRVTSHLELDSTSDPRATHAYFSTSTVDQDLEIIGEVIAPSHPDSSEFFILKYRVCNQTGTPVSPLYLGMIMDWDVSSFADGSGCDEGLNLIWQKSTSRYAGLAYLSRDSAFGASVIDNETYLNGDYQDKDLFNFITTPGFHANLQFLDLSSVMSLKIDQLAPGDTAEAHFVLALSRVGADDLKDNVVEARLFVGVALARGDVNGDGDIQLSDVVYLINYVLKSGPEPVPVVLVGDVNCDNAVGLADVVYLINYILKSGPPPCIQ